MDVEGFYRYCRSRNQPRGKGIRIPVVHRTPELRVLALLTEGDQSVELARAWLVNVPRFSARVLAALTRTLVVVPIPPAVVVIVAELRVAPSVRIKGPLPPPALPILTHEPRIHHPGTWMNNTGYPVPRVAMIHP